MNLWYLQGDLISKRQLKVLPFPIKLSAGQFNPLPAK